MVNYGRSVAGGGAGPPRPEMLVLALFAKCANFCSMDVRRGCNYSNGNYLSRDNKCLWLVRRCSARSLKKGPDSKAQ